MNVGAQTPGGGSADWQTPPELYLRLHQLYAFDFDAFASHENALAPRYSTPDGTFKRMRTGAVRTINGSDGLAASWAGRRVFCNPPYTRGLIEQCVAKMAAERDRAAIIVALLPANIGSAWFHEYVMPFAHIEWLPQRVHFIDPATGKPGTSPSGGTAVALYRPELMP